MNSGIFNWLGLAGCLAMSFLLSGMEAGVFALSRLRVRRLARAGRPSARLLRGFLENPEDFLWTILVGNTLANFFILGWVIVKLHEWLMWHHTLIVVIFAVVVFLFYALFDLLPKMLFRAHPNQLSLAMANVFRPVHVLLRPLVWLVKTASTALLSSTGGSAFTGKLFGNREEMRAVMQESAQALTSEERAMVNRVLDLQNFTVRQIATPLAQVVAVEAQTPIRDVLALACEKKLSRLPVWETRDGRRRIAGLLALDVLLFRADPDLEKSASACMGPALFVDEGMRLEIALRLMQRAGHRLAIVLGRDRVETGIVSLEDILKVMFGEVKL
jgi:CBS domain containing-hemolysin-like protein